MKIRTTYYLILGFLLVFACKEDPVIDDSELDAPEEISTPDWSESTHSNSTDPNYEIVFEQDVVLRFDIKIDPEDWQTMQNDLSQNLSSGGAPVGPPASGPGMGISSFDPVWGPCSVLFNDTEWYKVGIRYKGNSSLRSSYRAGINKLSFKIDFDQFEDEYPAIKNQRFYGFKQLNLKNNFEDRSMMREKVASDLFLDFGIASPQTAFCVVYVDHGSGAQYYGVYTLVEEVDDTVLENQFGDDSGNLYKPDGGAASFAIGTFNESQMEKKNNEDEGDYSDVFALYTALNSSTRTSDLERWKNDLNTVFDVTVFFKWLAANNAMQNWDTYGKMTHNFYLYNNPENNLLYWIPWDNNEALQDGKQGGALSLSLNEVGNGWPLIRYLVDVPEYKQQYEKYLKQFVDEVFVPSTMNAIYSGYFELLKQYVYEEQPNYTFLSGDADFDAAVGQLKNHVQARTEEVVGYLE
ncbi:CotH kinase family protein [Sunxiuqinia sp. A32]|uniref:CotH kinase family protein n=1 Tax=Sunxiuqinia sp. A32 TaxID=3461496 RepID=UPI0040467844